MILRQAQEPVWERVAAAATETAENNPVLNISIFGAFVAMTLFIMAYRKQSD